MKKANTMHIAKPNIVCCHYQNNANLYGALYHLLTENDRLEGRVTAYN
ncbi:hypothetical protein NCCP28_35640 [Niallia sp. NCCP-28]|nr:hypothetical protein NCCP28_35640 [Niallia sp. NCCP-28]